MTFKKIDPKDLQLNPLTTFLEEWPLLTAGDACEGYNTMTISWGHLGGVWNKPTLTVYVRPQRYTKEFVDHHELFTVSVLPSAYKKTLHYLGTVSGQDEDKIEKAGLVPVFDQQTTYFKEAKLVFICRKVYQAPIQENGFLNLDVKDKMYPEKDFHTMYIGEIVDILVNTDG